MAEAAKRLGVNRSTVTRWVRSGKIARPGDPLRERPDTDAPAIPPASGSGAGAFEAWAVRRYHLSRVEHELVKLADAALVTAHDANETPGTRLAAAREFRALAVAVNLPKLDADDEDGDSNGDTPATIYGFPRGA